MNLNMDEEQQRERIAALPILIDIDEAAFILRTSQAVVLRLIAGRELAAVEMAGQTRVNTEAIRAWANRGLREQLEAQLRALDRIGESVVTQ